MVLNFCLKNLLNFILIVPLFGAFSLLIIPIKNYNFLKNYCLNITFLTFFMCFLLWLLFQKNMSNFQFVVKNNWLNIFNFNFTLGIDGISLLFILLTVFLFPITILVSWESIKYEIKKYLFAFLLLKFFLINVFCLLDLLLFYIFFESILIPMFLIIGFWGSRSRKIRAAYYFFLYTLLGSILMLLSIFYIYFQIGGTDFETLLSFSFSFFEQKILWFTFFISFATKVPMLPFHLWLPEAHVEAPTAGSIVLAGVLLKLGIYGLIRFTLTLFSKASFYFAPLVYALAITGIIFTSLTAVRQTDFKKIIAYSSIAHMNLVILGIFSFSVIGIEGAILQSLSHGFVASALFFIIGVVYDRYYTRIIKYYGGLVHVMPVFTLVFLFFTMANIALPGSSSFIGEFLILAGSFKTNTTITVLGGISMVLGGCYSLWLFNRIVYGNLKIQYINNFIDLNNREVLIFLPLVITTLLFGLAPNIILKFLHTSVNFLVEIIYF